MILKFGKLTVTVVDCRIYSFKKITIFVWPTKCLSVLICNYNLKNLKLPVPSSVASVPKRADTTPHLYLYATHTQTPPILIRHQPSKSIEYFKIDIDQNFYNYILMINRHDAAS